MRSLAVLVVILSVSTAFPGSWANGDEDEVHVLVQPPSRSDLVFENYEINSGEDVLWEDISVKIIGNLSIWGTLTVINSTIEMIPNSASRNYVLIVSIGAHVTFTDRDDDPSTTYDRTVLRGGERGIDMYPHWTGYEYNPILEIRNSDIENVTFMEPWMNATGVRFINSSMVSPYLFPTFSNVSFIGNGSGNAMELRRGKDWELSGITVSNYGTGILVPDGLMEVSSLSLADCTISDCTSALATDNDVTVRITGGRFSDLERFDVKGALSMSGTTLEGGTFDFRGLRSDVLGCTFLSMERASNLSSGVLRGCTFDGCTIGLLSPSDMLIVENRFEGCNIAIKDDSYCMIFHNSFRSNWRVAEGYIWSNWYNDSLEEGNHYDTYSGLDDGQNGRKANDGKGDTDIPYLARDMFPLIKDHYWDMPLIPSLWLDHKNGTDAVSLVWDQTASDFVVQRSFDEEFQSGLKTWSVSDIMLVVRGNPNSTLFFRIASFNEVGFRGWSLPAVVRVDQAPLAPKNVQVSSVPEGSALSVSWEWVGEDVASAYVFYSVDGQGDRYLKVDHPATTTTIRELDNGVIYSMRIRTEDALKQLSTATTPVNCTPVDEVPPPPPRDIMAKAISNTTVSLEWNPPFIQDVSGYVIYRTDEPDGELSEITRLPSEVNYFEDRGLMDNTRYYYALSSIDDDGPISPPSPIVEVVTDHYNSPPLFIGSEEIVYMVEDMGPGSFDLAGSFSDPDGDRLFISVLESFPFTSEVIWPLLWVVPDDDQAGEGYVQLSVSDGEEEVPFLIGIIVEEVNDPPKNVLITSPLNGSVLLPGHPLLLNCEAEDPDLPYGDDLIYSWSSDIDGQLLESSLSSGQALPLTPGIHNISLTVSDSRGSGESRQVMIIVSLWGWGDKPWWCQVLTQESKVTRSGGTLTVKVTNDGPLLLSLTIEGMVQTDPKMTLMEKTFLIGPRMESTTFMVVPSGLSPGEEYSIEILIRAKTLNETYAGTQRIMANLTVTDSEGDDVGGNEVKVIMLLSGAFLLLVLTIIVALLVLGRKREDLLKGRTEGGNGGLEK